MQKHKGKMHKNAKRKLLVFIVAYNAAMHIEAVLDRIPQDVWNSTVSDCDILVIDDHSSDNIGTVINYYQERTKRSFEFRRNTSNLGYGGKQKLGYHHAIKNKYDAVILLHGDGQYAPELITELATPTLLNEADVVIGSRMINKKSALAGGMPRYKFFGNIVVTTLQNMMLGTKLSEFHSGYRVYRTAALRQVPFAENANYFDFDTDILIQMIDTKQRLLEIPIPTFYGSEICHVNGLKYVSKVLFTTLISRLQHIRFFKRKKFDYS